MKKTILSSVIGLATLSAMVSSQALAQDTYYFRYPIAGASNDSGAGGSTGSETGGSETETGGETGGTESGVEESIGSINIDILNKQVYAVEEKLGLWFEIEAGVDLTEQFTLTLTSSNGDIVISDFLDDNNGVGSKEYKRGMITDTSIDISSIYAIGENLTIKIDALDTNGDLVSKTTSVLMESNVKLGNTYQGVQNYYYDINSTYESERGVSFNLEVDNIDYSQPVSYSIEALDDTGSIITSAPYNIYGDIYYNTDNTVSSISSNAPSYYHDPSYENAFFFDAEQFATTAGIAGLQVSVSALDTNGGVVNYSLDPLGISPYGTGSETTNPEDPTVVDGYVTISNAVINDSKQLSFDYDAGGDVNIDTTQGLEILLSSSLGNETFYEYYAYGNVSNYDLGGIYVPNEDLNIQLSYVDENGTAGQDTATVLMPEVAETGGTVNVVESIVRGTGFADKQFEIALSNAEIDYTQPIQLTAYFNDFQGAVDMGFTMDQVYFDGEVILDGSNTVTSNTVSSSNYNNIIIINTANPDNIKSFTNTDSLVVDIVATDTSGNTVTQQDSLAL